MDNNYNWEEKSGQPHQVQERHWQYADHAKGGPGAFSEPQLCAEEGTQGKEKVLEAWWRGGQGQGRGAVGGMQDFFHCGLWQEKGKVFLQYSKFFKLKFVCPTLLGT